MSKPYWVYLLECADGSYYCGIALDVQARFEQHQAGTGAAYTRAHKPLQVLASRQYPTRSEALKAEYAIKLKNESGARDIFPAGTPLVEHPPGQFPGFDDGESDAPAASDVPGR